MLVATTVEQERTVPTTAIEDQLTELDYRGHKITLLYRPTFNDWQYTVHTTITYTHTKQAALYMTAVRDARRYVDHLHTPYPTSVPATME